MQEGGGEPPHGSLGSAINESFSSFEKLIAKMNAEGAAVQGSGWVVCSPAILAYSLLVLYNKNFFIYFEVQYVGSGLHWTKS